MKIEFIPASLIELPQWVLWRYEQRGKGKPTKLPYRIDGKGRADTTDRATWGTFEEALNAHQHKPSKWAGIGFVFAKDGGLIGVDLDDSLDADGELQPWAREV